jgi:hypothetical protein
MKRIGLIPRYPNDAQPYAGYKAAIPIVQGLAYGTSTTDTSSNTEPQTTKVSALHMLIVLGGFAAFAYFMSRLPNRKSVTRIGALEIADYGGGDKTLGLKGLPFQLKL